MGDHLVFVLFSAATDAFVYAQNISFIAHREDLKCEIVGIGVKLQPFLDYGKISGSTDLKICHKFLPRLLHI